MMAARKPNEEAPAGAPQGAAETPPTTKVETGSKTAAQGSQEPETDVEQGHKAGDKVEAKLMTYSVAMDAQEAAAIRANPPPEMEVEQTMAAVGKYKTSRLKYDLASIIGGRIVAVVFNTDETGSETQKVGLVVEVEEHQSSPASYIVWPVKDLADLTSPITDFEINRAE